MASAAGVADERLTMDAKTLFESGKLSAAVEQLSHDVRAHPVDVRQRTFLFEVLCLAGDYERAGRQLDVIAQQDAKTEVGVEVYRSIMVAEKARARLTSDGLMPDFLLQPPPFAMLHLEAVNRLREGHPAEARALLEKAAESEAPTGGRADGEAFADFSDGDSVLGPLLELFLHSRYVWIPFAQIKNLSIAAPKKLRDLIWIPATLETVEAPVGGVFIPVLYRDSWRHANDQVKLGRMTDWQELGEGLLAGMGQRIFFVDDGEKPILELRELAFGAAQ
jgi:type VI secretion system protein ImpE